MNLKLKHWTIATVIVVPSLTLLWALVTGAPTGRTGGFGEPTCRDSDCHIGNPLDAPGGSLTITGVPDTYSPSVVYPIRITINRTGQSRWGFELAARFENNGQRAGTLQPVDGNAFIQFGSNGVQYATHTLIGTRAGTSGGTFYNLNWVAPATPNGRIRFHAAGNAANNNNQPTGDFIYATSVFSDPKSGSGTSTTTATTSTTTTIGPSTTTTTSTTVTTTSTTTTTTQPPAAVLYFPRLVQTTSQWTGFAVANTGQSSASVTFSAFDNTGSILGGAAGTAEAITNPRLQTMTPQSQIAEVAFQTFGDSLNTAGAWAKVTSNQPGLTGFYLTFDPALNTMDGADVSDRLSRDFIIAEVQNNAEISLVNPDNSQAAIAVISLVNNQGVLQDTQPVQIPPNGRFSNVVSNMFSSSLIGAGGYLSVNSSLGLAATEVFGVADVYTAALNAVETSGGARELFSPQYVVEGGVWKTTLTLINLESSSTTISLRLLGDNGAQIGQTASVALPGKGRAVLSDPAIFGVNASGPIVQGYVRISSGTTRVAGYVRFGDPADAQFQTALPFVTQGRNEVIYSQVAQDATFFTGVAIINATPDPATVTVTVFNTDGAQVGSGQLTIQSNARISKLLSEILPVLPPMSKGYFRVSSNRPVFSFGVFGTNTLSVLSAVPPQALSSP